MTRIPSGGRRAAALGLRPQYIALAVPCGRSSQSPGLSLLSSVPPASVSLYNGGRGRSLSWRPACTQAGERASRTFHSDYLYNSAMAYSTLLYSTVLPSLPPSTHLSIRVSRARPSPRLRSPQPTTREGGRLAGRRRANLLTRCRRRQRPRGRRRRRRRKKKAPLIVQE